MGQSKFQALLDSIQNRFEEGDPEVVIKKREQKHVGSVLGQYTALGAGDIGAYLKHLHKQVTLEIHAPDMFPWVRRAHGVEQVRAAVLQNFSVLEDQAPQILAVVAQGNVVDLLLHETGRVKQTQKPYDVTGFIQFIFKQGKVAAVREVVSLTSPEA